LIRPNHKTVTFGAKSQYCLPNVDFGNFCVQNYFSNYRTNVFQIFFGSGSSPFECLSHIVTGAKGKRYKINMTNIDERLKHLNGPHDAAIAAHKRNYYLSTTIVAFNCLLNHLVASIAIVGV